MNKILISHRGNIFGSKPEQENKPEYILKAISNGFDVEIDIWNSKDKLFLGHDNPETNINKDFLLQNRQYLWCHAKNLTALEKLLDMGMTCFWHQEDYYTLTSNNYIWTYPDQSVGSNSIWVMPEMAGINETQTDLYLSNCIGICSDFIGEYIWTKQ
jgi:hypothetical protein